MQFLGDYRIDDYITFGAQLHRFSSGAVYAPTGNVTYTFYENNSTSGAPTGGNLAQLNSKTGLYTARVQLTTASGFEAGKEYLIHLEATVDSVAAAELLMFRIIGNPKVDVDTIKTQSVTCAAGVTVPASIASPTNITAATGITVSTNSDKTGYSLAADQAVNVTKVNGTSQTAGDLAALINALDAIVDNIHDTDLPAVKSDTAAILADTGTDGVVVASGSKSGYSLASGAITADVVATGAIDADALATDAVTEIQTGLATSAELAKVPKSDGSSSWNATALAAINAEVDTALNTAIPGSPVANSVNERVKAVDDKLPSKSYLTGSANSDGDVQLDEMTGFTSGSVATDGSNSATSFKTDLSSAVNDFWNDALVLLTSGALAGQVKKVIDYNGTTKFITVEDGFTSTPADGVTFLLINR